MKDVLRVDPNENKQKQEINYLQMHLLTGFEYQNIRSLVCADHRTVDNQRYYR
jgi:hypothetical protein